MTNPADPDLLSRRAFLRRAAATSLALPLLTAGLPPRLARAEAGELTPHAGASDIRARDAWGADLPPLGDLQAEAPEDVRFFVLHHSASGNDYEPEAVPGILQSFYRFHTGERGWADLAYNFLVDRYGVVWEGRQGSLTAPIKGDATGGSQGFALLACWIGDHQDEPPTDAAQQAMAGLLAALSVTYHIDPQGTTTFVSRGSNLHPEGTEVRTATLAGHREMSQTACPGDAGQRIVTDVLPGKVAAAVDEITRSGAEPRSEAEPDPAIEPTEPPQAAPRPTEAASPEPTPEAHEPERVGAAPPGDQRPPPDSGGLGPGAVAAGIAGAVLAAAGGAAAVHRHRSAAGSEPTAEDPPAFEFHHTRRPPT